MKRILVKPDYCKRCEECGVMKNCEFTALIREEKGDVPFVDLYRCSGCELCILKVFCPNNALEIIRHPCNGGPAMGW
jgi:MinD superfamily P-loop ATPase